MPRRSRPPSGERPRLPVWTFLVVLGILVLVYLESGSLPDEVLDAVPGDGAPATQVIQRTRDEPTPAPPTPGDRAAAASAVTAEEPTATRSPVQATAAILATPTPQQTRGPTLRTQSGLPAIAYDNLPRQAKETIALIDQGGPFPYRQDDTVFQNRERLLPIRERGHYREYTVVTPGSRDRGARRIVAGAAGELYYTEDHYRSFREVIR
jgi:ribonuclease T1